MNRSSASAQPLPFVAKHSSRTSILGRLLLGHSTSVVATAVVVASVPERACDRWGIAPFTQSGRGFETRFSPNAGLATVARESS
jgi:hypothetical protein